MTNSTHKRGDTFDRSGTISVTQNGTPLLDLTGWTGASQVRDKFGQLLAQLTFVWIDATNSLARLYTADSTEGWTIGEAKMDIQMTSPAGAVLSTATAAITVIEDITHG